LAACRRLCLKPRKRGVLCVKQLLYRRNIGFHFAGTALGFSQCPLGGCTLISESIDGSLRIATATRTFGDAGYAQFVTPAGWLRNGFAALDPPAGRIRCLAADGLNADTCTGPPALASIIAHVLRIQSACMICIDGLHGRQIGNIQPGAGAQSVQVAVDEGGGIGLQQGRHHLIDRSRIIAMPGSQPLRQASGGVAGYYCQGTRDGSTSGLRRRSRLGDRDRTCRGMHRWRQKQHNAPSLHAFRTTQCDVQIDDRTTHGRRGTDDENQVAARARLRPYRCLDRKGCGVGKRAV